MQGQDEDIQVILNRVEAYGFNGSLQDLVLHDIAEWEERVNAAVWIYRY